MFLSRIEIIQRSLVKSSWSIYLITVCDTSYAFPVNLGKRKYTPKNSKVIKSDNKRKFIIKNLS